jgi:hypothetical protein
VDMCPRHVGGRYPTPGSEQRALQPSPRLSLHADDLTQPVHHVHQIALRFHHRVDRLVRHRRLVDSLRVVAALDARCRLDALGPRLDGNAGVGLITLAVFSLIGFFSLYPFSFINPQGLSRPRNQPLDCAPTRSVSDSRCSTAHPISLGRTAPPRAQEIARRPFAAYCTCACRQRRHSGFGFRCPVFLAKDTNRFINNFQEHDQDKNGIATSFLRLPESCAFR